MQKAPRITVLMTLYNKGPYVEEAVRSVLAQTFADFELLVVDDASTDGGLDIVKAIGDPRIRILENAENTGRAAAANRGYDAASGEYIAVLDGDDVMFPERLAKQVAFMDSHPLIGISGGACQVLGEQGRSGHWPAADPECRAGLLFGDALLYGTAIMRRDVVEAHRLRCNTAWRWPGMDYLFTLSFHAFTRYGNLAEPLIAYRMGRNNMRHGRNPAEDKVRLIQEVFRQFNLPLTERELGLQLAFHEVLAEPFMAARVRELHDWKLKLACMNRDRGLFPETLFQAELDRRWRRLFHAFADHDLGAALAHLRLSGNWPKDRLTYLAKTTINRWVGRKP
ncbi:MAG: glycosyltransferase family 2 protein [Bacteroidetes bacterium]|nr:glycosyltransferase family 2 protein [Bacteroidota bacterium]